MSNITSKILSNEKKNCVSRKIVQFNLLELIHLLKKPTHSSTSFPRPKFPSKRRVSTTFLHLWSETVCLSCPTRHSGPKSIISFGKSYISGYLQSHISQVLLRKLKLILCLWAAWVIRVIKSYILRRPQNFSKSPPFFSPM